jgi:hypothetical protein
MFAANTFRIRTASDGDALLLRRLCKLDGQRMLSTPALIGEMHGIPVAAISLVDGRIVSDPGVRTATVKTHLRMRARAAVAAARTPSLEARLRAATPQARCA